jgi:hypothetical protein
MSTISHTALSAPGPLQAGSITFKEAGALIRLAHSRARSCNPTERKVLDAVIDLTATYSKQFDKTYAGFIAELAGIDRTDPTAKKTRRALRSLNDRRIISYEPARHHGQMTIIGLRGAEADR